MRPGDFSPGNIAGKYSAAARGAQFPGGFNEAGGFLPRKQRADRRLEGVLDLASMRPGDFSPGNWTSTCTRRVEVMLQ